MTKNLLRHEILGLPFDPQGIPQPLKDQKRWLVFELTFPNEDLTGKPVKVPCIWPGQQTRRYSSSDESTWLTFDDAYKRATANRAIKLKAGQPNVSFVPAFVVPMNYYFVDLDNHDLDPVQHNNHMALIEATAGAYAEWSISGTGQHIGIPQGWKSASSIHKDEDDKLDLKIQHTGQIIILTGVLISPKNGSLVPASQWSRVIEDFFTDASGPDSVFEEDEDLGEEHDATILEMLAEDTRWQLDHTLTDNGHPSYQGRDGSDRFSRVIKDVLKHSRNLAVTSRILEKSVVAQYDARTPNHARDTPQQYNAWQKRCAKSVIKEMVKQGLGVKVKFNLPNTFGEAKAIISAKDFQTERVVPAAQYLAAAPGGFQWLVNEILNSMDKSTRIYDFAIGAAIATLSAFAGKKFVCPVGQHHNFLCTNIVLVGDSGTGKSLYASLMSKIQRQAVMANPQSPLDRIGYAQPKASKAFVNALNDPGKVGHMFYFPEFGKQLATTFRTNTNNPDDFSAVLMDASTNRKIGGMVHGTQRANNDNNIATVYDPCYSMLGDSTQELILQHSTRSDFDSGFLARFLLIPNNEVKFDINDVSNPFDDDSKPFAVSPELLARLEDIARTPDPITSGILKPEPVYIRPVNKDYGIVIMKQIALLREKYKGDPNRRAFYNRMPEYVFTIAALIGLIDNPYDPKLEDTNMDWAFKYVSRCITAWTEATSQILAPAETSNDIVFGLLKVYKDIFQTYYADGWDAVKERFPEPTKYVLKESHLQEGGFPVQLFKQNAKYVKTSGNITAANKVILEHLTDMVDQGLLTLELKPNAKGKPTALYCLTDDGKNVMKNL